MKLDYSISIYLDARRAKANGKYPVKLRVYTSNPRKQKLYPTAFEFTAEEFNSIWETSRPRSKYKELRKQLQAVELKANKVANKLVPFTFEQFERKLYRKSGDAVRIAFLYNSTIQELIERHQVANADIYGLALKSFIKYVEKQTVRNYNTLTLYDTNTKWLKDYEYFMNSIKGRSFTTVSMYVRTLRSIFNKAIAEGDIEKEYYPFGKGKYEIPSTRNIKKALSKEHLKILFNTKPSTPDQEKAKDFWFFSYACNGMNIKDIAQLRFKDIQDGVITFYRAKTRITSKGNLKPITTHLNSYSSSIIEKYGSKDKNPENLIFDIISEGLSPEKAHARIKNFTRFINQHLKKLAKANGLPENISTYWARHSFATNAVLKGASMEFIQESLGHKDLKTTQNYFAGFDDESKKEFSKIIMDFD